MKKNQNKYVTDSKLEVVMDRLKTKHYELTESITSKFEVVNQRGDISLCGKVRVAFDIKTSKAKLHDSLDNKVVCYDFEKKPQTHHSGCKQISSALALYRTIALFKCGLNADNCDFYKLNWEVFLKHKKTGKILGLGEWKGGFQIFTEAYSTKELPKEFIKDAEALLTLLASVECPIGYDGTIAGTIA